MGGGPGAGGPDAGALEGLEFEGDGLALAGLLQADPLRADVQEEAGLQLAGVVAGVVEGLPAASGASCQKLMTAISMLNRACTSRTIGLNSLPPCALSSTRRSMPCVVREGDVGEDRGGGGGGEADRRHLVELLGVVAEGDCGQDDDLRARVSAAAAACSASVVASIVSVPWGR